MTEGTSSFLDRVRRPEYTGENRCVPCTAVNVGLAGVASALVALVAPVPAAVFVFALSLVAVYLRGYLVPGTPALTGRYLPTSVRERFDHPQTATTTTTDFETLRKVEAERANAVEPTRFLVDEGVVEEPTDGVVERYTDEFEAVLDERLDSLRDAPLDRERVATLFEVSAADVEPEDREYPAFTIGRRIRKWPSEAALLTDVAIHETLASWTERWADVPQEQRLNVLESSRELRDACPACTGDLDTSGETVESCCGVHRVVALECADCGDRLLERSPDASGGKLTRR